MTEVQAVKRIKYLVGITNMLKVYKEREYHPYLKTFYDLCKKVEENREDTLTLNEVMGEAFTLFMEGVKDDSTILQKATELLHKSIVIMDTRGRGVPSDSRALWQSEWDELRSNIFHSLQHLREIIDKGNYPPQ